MINEFERIDDLEIEGLKIIQNTNRFCFGTDAVLLADYVKTKRMDTVIDLGTGTGILPLLIWAKNKPQKIIGVEIQQEMVEMAKRSVSYNHLDDMIKIHQGDIKQIQDLLEREKYDHVVANPPYMKNHTGFKNHSTQKSIARHEVLCSGEDVVKAAFYLLKFKGTLTMVHRPERMTDVMTWMRKYRIEPKNIKLIYHKHHQPPVLFLIRGIKGSEPSLKWDTPLVIKNQLDQYTHELLKIYGKDRKDVSSCCI